MQDCGVSVGTELAGQSKAERGVSAGVGLYNSRVTSDNDKTPTAGVSCVAIWPH